MAEISKIEWTDATFNGWIGCTKISPGCDNCYAEALSQRYGWAKWGDHARKRTSTTNWQSPVKWNAEAKAFEEKHGRRRRVFSASLSDWLDNQVPKEWRADLFRMIRATPNLDWQLLTKRPQNIAKMLPADWGGGYPNVWLGTTTEDEKHFRMRWPILSRIPAAVRFISYEPAVGPLGTITGPTPDWIIAGGESGPGARTLDPRWARDVRDQSVALGIAFFFKQWGTYRSNPVSQAKDPPSNGKGGALLDSQLWRQFPVDQRVQRRAIA